MEESDYKTPAISQFKRNPIQSMRKNSLFTFHVGTPRHAGDHHTALADEKASGLDWMYHVPLSWD